jgi:hypothetical protein
MKEKDGISLPFLIDHKDTLIDFYFRITGNDGPSLNNIYDFRLNVPSQLISKINHKLEKNLGETLASYYKIDKRINEPHKIIIDGEYVTTCQ